MNFGAEAARRRGGQGPAPRPAPLGAGSGHPPPAAPGHPPHTPPRSPAGKGPPREEFTSGAHRRRHTGKAGSGGRSPFPRPLRGPRRLFLPAPRHLHIYVRRLTATPPPPPTHPSSLRQSPHLPLKRQRAGLPSPPPPGPAAARWVRAERRQQGPRGRGTGGGSPTAQSEREASLPAHPAQGERTESPSEAPRSPVRAAAATSPPRQPSILGRGVCVRGRRGEGCPALGAAGARRGSRLARLRPPPEGGGGGRESARRRRARDRLWRQRREGLRAERAVPASPRSYF